MSNDESLSALLRIDFAQADLLPRFREIADVLLNRVDLLAGDTRFEICELEFYARTPAHNDVFAHTDPLQQTFLQWYFHRSGPGKAYKEGTYRGLDLALGDAAADAHCGVLLRSLRTPTGDIVQGSCLSANALLAATGCASVAALADSLQQRGQLCAAARDAAHPLRLVLRSEPRSAAVHASLRVGLTLKKRDDAELRRRFIGAPYRFFTCVAQLRKGAPQIVAALASDGLDAASIASLTQIKPQTVQRYVDAYAQARATGSLASFAQRAIKPAEYAALLGAWEKEFADK